MTVAGAAAGESPDPATPPVAATAPATTKTTGGPAAAARRRLVFAVTAMALLMAAIDQTIVATALPSIQRELHSTLNWSPAGR